jgi:23S rRNA-intervening sequence protein
VPPILSFRDLIVWQQGLELAKLCYFKTRSFPRSEAFGLTSQIRRAAASITGKSERVGKLLRALIRSLQEKVEG